MKRRAFIGTAAAAAFASLAARAQRFQPPQDIQPLVRELTRGATLGEGGIDIDLPALAENGNSVLLHVAVPGPMTAEDHVAVIHVIAERNPRPLVASFHFGAASGRADVITRMRLAGTQKVTVIAERSGGRFHVAQKEVVVTSAACLDESM